MSDPANPAAATPAPAAAAPPKPPMPAKPAPAKPAAKTGEGRRFFLFRPFALAWTAFCAAMAAMTFGTIRFMVPNVLSEPPSKVKVGDPRNFDEGKVSEAFK